MPRPTKKQINIKMPEALIEALKTRAESENDTFTDLITRACEQYLESKSDVKGGQSSSPQTTASPFEPAQLDERIAESIAAEIAPLLERVASVENELQQVLGEAAA